MRGLESTTKTGVDRFRNVDFTSLCLAQKESEIVIGGLFNEKGYFLITYSISGMKRELDVTGAEGDWQAMEKARTMLYANDGNVFLLQNCCYFNASIFLLSIIKG